MAGVDSQRAADIIRAEIAAAGAIPFGRFMELALYAPDAGYYTRGQDPFGKYGDFFTAAQLQPVFGILIARCIARLRAALGSPAEFRVVELGAGRGEMADALAPFRYQAVDVGRGRLPDRFTGVVFANEFFDALPVRLAVRRGRGWRELLVGERAGRFALIEGPPAAGALRSYLARYHSAAAGGSLIEAHLRALDWIARIAESVDQGYLLAIDYGYTAAELIRFPAGTLMSYRRHVASDDVLSDPGERDITAHVPFTPLEDAASRSGWRRERFETLAGFLLSIGEEDEFAEALAAGSPAEALRRRLQLKTLLAGMGETFRVLLLRKCGQK
jgi:SAM-dependent MidA family methyltransferase